MVDGKGLIIGEVSNRQDVAEENLHHEQRLKYGKDYFTTHQTQMEIEAQGILLRMDNEEGSSKEAMNEISTASS